MFWLAKTTGDRRANRAGTRSFIAATYVTLTCKQRKWLNIFRQFRINRRGIIGLRDGAQEGVEYL